MRVWLKSIVGALLLLVTLALPALAERRVALVIGNSTYKSVPALTNPRNDAEDIANALRDLGFEVMMRTDVEKNAIRPLLKEFSRLVAGADTALVYYAGHALQYRGRYFLMPTDAALEDEDALKYDMIAADDVREAMARVGGIKIMIFDACRNDPFNETGGGAPQAQTPPRGLTRGLTRVVQPQGSIIAYATAPLDVAEDGSKRNSPFTRSLLKWVKEPGLEIRQLFQRVSVDVSKETKGRQVPELTISMLADYYLNKAETDRSLWSRIRYSSEPSDFRDFVTRFPDSDLVPDARYRLEVIERARKVRDEIAQRERERLKAEQERIRAEQERQRQEEEARRQREAAEACRAATDKVAEVAAGGQRDALVALKSAAPCPEAVARVDAAIADLDRRKAEAEEQARAEAACRKERDQIAGLAQQDRENELRAMRAGKLTCAPSQGDIDQALAAIQTKKAARAHDEACQKEVAQVEQLAQRGRKDELAQLKAKAQCPEQSATRIDVALGAITQREAEEQLAKRAAQCKSDVERVRTLAERSQKGELDGLRKGDACGEAKDAAGAALAQIETRERDEACRQDQAAVDDLAKAGKDKELEAFRAKARCAEATNKIETALQTIAARRIEDAKQRAEAEAKAQREAICREERTKVTALATAGQKAELETYGAAAKCEATPALVATALDNLRLAEQKICEAEQTSFGAIDRSDEPRISAFASTAKCPDVAERARAELARLKTQRETAERQCADEKREIDRLAGLGEAGRDDLKRMSDQLGCVRLKPIVTAALDRPDVPQPPTNDATPPVDVPKRVNTDDQIKHAQERLAKLGCFTGSTDRVRRDRLNEALKSYFGRKGPQGASLDVDDELLSRLDAEPNDRICPLECGDGEVERGGRCVAEKPDKPRRDKPVVRRDPEPQRPVKQVEQRPAPPPVAPPQPERRSRQMILGN